MADERRPARRSSLAACAGLRSQGSVDSVSATSSAASPMSTGGANRLHLDEPVPAVADHRADEHDRDRPVGVAGRQLGHEPAAHRMAGEDARRMPARDTWARARRTTRGRLTGGQALVAPGPPSTATTLNPMPTRRESVWA